MIFIYFTFLERQTEKDGSTAAASDGSGGEPERFRNSRDLQGTG